MNAVNENNDEIALKDLILLAQDYFAELFRHKIILFAFIFLAVSIFIYIAHTTPPEYPANLTFMINEDKGGAMAGVAGLLSNFGLKGKQGEYNLEKILFLARSQKIVRQALFEREVVDGKADFLANHLIAFYFDELWENNNTGLKGFRFKSDDFSSFSIVENRAFKSVYSKVVGNKALDIEGLMNNSIDEDTGVITFSFNTVSEDFSILFIHRLFEKLGDFYVEKQTEKQARTVDLVKSKTDSIYNLLKQTEYQLADFKDSNRGLWSNKDELKEMKLRREVQMLKLIYGESLKNLEIADFTLKNKTPFVQSIDLPFAPILPIVKSKIIAVIIGLIVGGFFGSLFILIPKVYRDIMNG